MSKILLVTLEYPPHCAGVGYYYQSLVGHLPLGSVTVLTAFIGKLQIANCELPLDELSQSFKESAIPVLPAGRRNPQFEVRREFFWRMWPRWGRLVIELVRILRKERYNWIAIGQVLPIGTAAVIARFIAQLVPQLRVTSYQLLAFCHGMDVAQLRGRKRHLARWILKNCDLVIANSQFTKGALVNLGVSADNVHVLTPCPAMSDVRCQKSEVRCQMSDVRCQMSEVRSLILSVGRLVARKGFDSVLRVYTKLREQYAGLDLKIIGDGPDRTRLEQLACELGLNPREIFLGAMEHEQIVPWYDCASVFLLLSRDEGNGDVEGFGMVFLEANAHGVPVVAGRSGGVPEAVIDTETGYLVDPLDIETAAARVATLLANEPLRARLGQQGRARVQKDFRWADRAKWLLELLSPHVIPSQNPVIPSRAEGSRFIHSDISIIIPTYNHAAELGSCIASLRRQTLPPTEIIIVDDGSTDSSSDVAEEEKRRGGPWQRFEVIRQSNQGAPTARNAGFAASSGSLILFSDADIAWKPHALETLSYAIKQHPDSAYAYSSFYFGWKLFRCGAFDPEGLKRVNFIHTSSLIRREHFPGFDPSLKKFQDWDLWLTMLEQGHTGFWVKEPLFHVAPRRTGMSYWYPSFMYTIPWQRFGIRIHAVKQYRQAEEIIRKKHQL